MAAMLATCSNLEQTPPSKQCIWHMPVGICHADMHCRCAVKWPAGLQALLWSTAAYLRFDLRTWRQPWNAKHRECQRGFHRRVCGAEGTHVVEVK